MEQSKTHTKPVEAAGKGTVDKDAVGASERSPAKRVLSRPAGLQFFSQYERGDLVRLKTVGSEHHVSACTLPRFGVDRARFKRGETIEFPSENYCHIRKYLN